MQLLFTLCSLRVSYWRHLCRQDHDGVLRDCLKGTLK